jgi:hypothetical protein
MLIIPPSLCTVWQNRIYGRTEKEKHDQITAKDKRCIPEGCNFLGKS